MNIARFTMSLFGINTYVVWDQATKDCAIIDPGMVNPSERQKIDGFIKTNGLHPQLVINTHLHIDHAVGNAWANSTYRIESAASEADLALGGRLKEQARAFGLPIEVSDPGISKYLKDGEVIKIGRSELKVISVPGHSPGGIALYDEADCFLISGDSLFEGSIGRTDLPGGDHGQLVAAVKGKLLSLPEDTIVYPGHGGPTTIGRERRMNPFLR